MADTITDTAKESNQEHIDYDIIKKFRKKKERRFSAGFIELEMKKPEPPLVWD